VPAVVGATPLDTQLLYKKLPQKEVWALFHETTVFQLCIHLDTCTYSSLVPRPPPCFVLRFAFSIIHGSGRARKTGKAWSHPSRV